MRCVVMNHDILTIDQWRTVSRELHLSNRELQIIQLIFDDRKERAIGSTLGIASHTVHTHLERLYRKLGVHSRCGAMLCIFGLVLLKTAGNM